MTVIQKFQGLILKVGNAIAASPNCCCCECGGGGCDCTCDPVITITVSWGGLTITGSCTNESPSSIVALTGDPSFGDYLIFNAGCVDGNWIVNFFIQHIEENCTGGGYGYANWDCELQSIVDFVYNSGGNPPDCWNPGEPSVSIG